MYYLTRGMNVICDCDVTITEYDAYLNTWRELSITECDAIEYCYPITQEIADIITTGLRQKWLDRKERCNG